MIHKLCNCSLKFGECGYFFISEDSLLNNLDPKITGSLCDQCFESLNIYVRVKCRSGIYQLF